MEKTAPCISLREDLAGLEPYDPGFASVDVLLSANENSCGIPAEVRAAMLDAIAAEAFNRYPDPMANSLRDAIAAWHGVDRANVVVGNGGDEIIFNLLLAFGGPGRTLVDCPPTFSIYALYAQLTSTDVRCVARNHEDFSLDAEGVFAAAADADIIMLTSPNNPTGNLADPAWVEELARSTRALVVVDEAYGEFADAQASCVPLVGRYANVAVLRTFSKAYGLAGMRCGYLLAAEDAVAGLSAVRQPYSVDVCAQAAARVAVEQRHAFDACIAGLVAERQRVFAALDAMDGVQVWPSAANFLLVRLPHAHEAYEALRDRFSILVRDFSRTSALKDCLRITIGTEEENNRVLAALSQLQEERS